MKNIQDNQREATLYSYLAGIIDGEGTIRINRTKPRNSNWNLKYSGAISVGMTDKKVIQLLVKVFGAKMRIECVPDRKLLYRWGTSGNQKLPIILKPLLPYLIVKRKQAELVIKFCEKSQTTGFRRNKRLPKKELQWREAIFQKVRNLNH